MRIVKAATVYFIKSLGYKDSANRAKYQRNFSFSLKRPNVLLYIYGLILISGFKGFDIMFILVHIVNLTIFIPGVKIYNDCYTKNELFRLQSHTQTFRSESLDQLEQRVMLTYTRRIKRQPLFYPYWFFV